MNLPNKITIARIIMVPTVIFFQYAAFIPCNNIIAMLLFVIAALSDMVDGRLARKYNLVTTFGKFIDPIADKLLVCLVIVVLVEQGAFPSIAAIIIIAREFLVSGLRLMAAEKGEVIAAGSLAKIKTTIQSIAVPMAIVRNWPFSLINLPLTDIVIWAAAAITVWSGIDYFIKHAKFLKGDTI